ncbi:molybdopterin-dependent oxidoreductase [Halobacillus amylolyticus]|uniref:Molybdopterin-dependent oxidoreductase n=1 Tax=Halobacillus amylolyticus TaxID=2932259 RepID=A0ABY4H8L8_9BACI|nr:molybdopterin-dependent oxidoreductase [Halobacillus amylolyticus]UOR10891.1 molybdopterin-dependent oxidoreductase [Halobacillus amylolyticus]
MEKWGPTKNDHHIKDQQEVDQWVHSTCNLCSIGCGCEIAVKENKLIGVRGMQEHQTNLGRLDPKAKDQWIANNSPDRLLHPLVRNHEGKLKEATWDQAMSKIVDKAKEVIQEKGPNGAAIYSTGQGFLEDYYTIAKIGRAGIGTHLLDANTRLCTATTEYCLIQSFGSDGVPASFEDLDHTDTVMFFGHNPAETGSVLFERVMTRKKKTGKPYMIVVDPRRTLTAEAADLHLPLKPGSNLALLNGLISEMIARNYVDAPFVQQHTVHFDEMKETAKEWSLEETMENTEIPIEKLEQAVEQLGQTSSLVSTTLQGAYQAADATATCVAINNLHLMRGLIGKQGSGPLHMAGQPSSSANRTVGGVGTYPGNRNPINPRHLREMAELWNVEEDKLEVGPEKGIIKQIEMMENDQIGFFWNIHTNPLVSLPNLKRAKEALKKPFVVVQDPFLTETAKIADVVLPPAMWGEKEGTMENADRTINLLRKAVEPPNGVKSDLDILLDFAKRMGFQDKDDQPLIQYETPEEAFEEWKKVSKGRPSDMTAMSYQKLEESRGMQWPANEENPEGTTRLYEDFQFNTELDYAQSYGKDIITGRPLSRNEYKEKSEAGKAIFYSTPYYEPSEQPSQDYPFWFNTGRIVWHWHTRTKTGRSPYLDNAAKEAYVEIHEEDVDQLGILPGEEVNVTSPRGSIKVPARVSNSISKGTVFSPFHFGNFEKEQAANELTIDVVDPLSHQPLYKNSVCQLGKDRGRHRVKNGETLAAIAQDYHLTTSQLMQANRLIEDSIVEGTTLEIPLKIHEVEVEDYSIPFDIKT